jgi:hypothetical protein
MKAILDIKTGKAQPWAALQVAAYTLLDTPVEFQERGHIYTHEGRELESVTTILGAEGFIDTAWFDDWSRDKGKAVHLACHYDDLDCLDEEDLDPVIIPYLEGWRKFRTDTGWVTELSEQPMMSSTYLYAGTPDAIGYLPGLKRAAVELSPKGTYKLIPYTDRNDVNVWLAVLACHNWKRNNLGRK